jgi:serine/threonine protein kinase/tetratricopeptide (TPR) repeat protein
VQPGTRLGPYEILTPLGAGGMGEVWRARDQRLHRDVAVKILLDGAGTRSPDLLVRFEREARAVAALSHPNILSIHDFGTHEGFPYAVMELLEGATLRERLNQTEIPLTRALDWGHQIAQGLAAAHERGIVHRDLKPENMFVTRDGLVKILDFGLARLEETQHPLIGQDTATLARTSPGLVIGTIVYLSPEQARGEVADPRSDIFAFGSVFYEMLTGRAAFQRDSAAETIVAILREAPKETAHTGRIVPGEVQDILTHCLEKDPNERFRSARDLAFALKLAARSSSGSGEAAARTTTRPPESTSGAHDLSVGVLPFRNMSPAADAEYFSDGMTEEIINSLSAVPGLHVAARTSSFAFKSRNDDIRKIGRDLGVAMVLEGSVRQSGARLRVTAQLVNVENGYHLWSNRWDRDVADVFAVQDEIAEAIASTLKLRVADKAATGGKTQNVEAYDRFLKGKYHFGQRRTQEAIADLDAAVAQDPDFADAHTALADAWAVRGYYGGVPTWEAWARSRSAVDEAQRIDPDSPGVALSLGIIEHYYGWNNAREEAYLRQAIERSPKSADAWGWLAICYSGSGRLDEAIAAGARGIELEPHHANVRASQAWAWGFRDDFETAERALRKAVEVDPTAGYARWTLGYVLSHSGKAAEGVSIFEGLVEETNRSVPFYVAMLGNVLARAGEKRRAEEIVEELQRRRNAGEFIPSMHLAFTLAGLRDDESALDALERAREERNAYVWGLMYLPDFKPLRDNPRWRALAERLGRSAPVQGHSSG